MWIGLPCTAEGHPLGADAAPPPRDNSQSCDPFPNRVAFEFAEYVYEKSEQSQEDVAHLLNILAARDVLYGAENVPSIFHNAEHFFETMDAIKQGQTKWKSVALRYAGAVDADSPSWMREKYVIHFRDTLEAVKNIAASTDFDGSFETAPYMETTTLPSGDTTRRISNLMSGQWANRKAVRRGVSLLY